jgi:hypothetical protein
MEEERKIIVLPKSLVLVNILVLDLAKEGLRQDAEM